MSDGIDFLEPCEACGENEAPICDGCGCCGECCNCAETDCDCDVCTGRRENMESKMSSLSKTIADKLRAWARVGNGSKEHSQDCEDAANLLDPLPEFKHKKRGTRYVVLTNNARFQSEDWLKPAPDGSHNIKADNYSVTVYQDVDSGAISVRPTHEFEDGRFEKL